MSAMKIKFTHKENKRLPVADLYVGANGKVVELTEDGFLIARHDIGFHLQWDGKKPSQTVNHAGFNNYKW